MRMNILSSSALFKRSALFKCRRSSFLELLHFALLRVLVVHSSSTPSIAQISEFSYSLQARKVKKTFGENVHNIWKSHVFRETYREQSLRWQILSCLYQYTHTAHRFSSSAGIIFRLLQKFRNLNFCCSWTALIYQCYHCYTRSHTIPRDLAQCR